MKKEKITFYGLLFILLYISAYYLWILCWKNQHALLTLGGNLFAIFGGLIGTIWLASTVKQSKEPIKTFWLLLSLGCLSFSIAQSVWMFYENILKVKVPFPGYPDLFYILQSLLYLAAFVYKISKERRRYQTITFLFDVGIVMTVASTLSWHYFISPILGSQAKSTFALLVSLAYPVSDLGILFGALTIYFGTRKTFTNKETFFLFSGLLIQCFADSSYMYLISINKYISSGLLDPLFILAILLIGFTGILHVEGTDENQKEEEYPQIQKLDFFRLLLPYINISILFIFIFARSNNMDAFVIGSSISVLLVIIRQILVTLQNQQLLLKYYKKSEELEASEQRYKSLFEFNPDPVFSIDLNGELDSVNTACVSLLSYEKEEMIGRHYSSFLSENDQERASNHFSKVMEGIPQTYEIPVRNNSGDYSDLIVTNIPILVNNKLIGVFSIGKDITENKRTEEKIKFLAYHDSLTGLPNRALFEEFLKEAIADANRTNEMFAVMFMDLDRFKTINDSLGHETGDQLLISVSKRLRACVRENDIVARMGGDEFTLLVKGISSMEGVKVVGQKILDALMEPYHIHNHEFTNTPSIGIAVYPKDGTTSETLIRKADMAMYQVKASSRNNFKLYEETFVFEDCK